MVEISLYPFRIFGYTRHPAIRPSCVCHWTASPDRHPWAFSTRGSLRSDCSRPFHFSKRDNSLGLFRKIWIYIFTQFNYWKQNLNILFHKEYKSFIHHKCHVLKYLSLILWLFICIYFWNLMLLRDIPTLEKSHHWLQLQFIDKIIDNSLKKT